MQYGTASDWRAGCSRPQEYRDGACLPQSQADVLICVVVIYVVVARGFHPDIEQAVRRYLLRGK